MKAFHFRSFYFSCAVLAGAMLCCDFAQADLFQRLRARRTSRNPMYQNTNQSYQMQTGHRAHPIEYGYGVESAPRRDHSTGTYPGHAPLRHGYGVETSPQRAPGHYGRAIQMNHRNQPLLQQGYSQESSPHR